MAGNHRDRVFVSYSHKDRKLYEEFRTMLAPAIRAGLIDVWDDTKIDPGAEWKDEIRNALASAKVAVLLVSTNFLASDFIDKHELPPLLEAAQNEGLTVFWICLGPCLYQGTEIARYQAAHDPAKPLNRLDKPQREAVLSAVCAKLIEIAHFTPIGSPANGAMPASRPIQAQSVSVTDSIRKEARSIDFMPVPESAHSPEVGRTETEQSLLHLFETGHRAIVVCGPANSGKSELVRGFTRANAILRGRAQFPLPALEPVGATLPGQVWFQPIAGAAKRVFVDPAGEFMTAAAPRYRRLYSLPQPTISDFDFIGQAIRHLAGIVLVVDLTRPNEENAREHWHDQEEDLQFLLQAIRWLRFADPKPSSKIGVTVQIAASIGSLPRLDVPVLVAFTKADLLDSYTRAVPREFARRRLPLLHGALQTHARRYRYDFSNTMFRTKSGDQPAERPCGVLLSLEWLLDAPFGWMHRLPTRLWESL